MLCRQETAAAAAGAAANAGTKRPRSQDETVAADSINGSAETPAAMATVDAAMSESAEIAAVAAAIAATDRADAVLHDVRFTNSITLLVLTASCSIFKHACHALSGHTGLNMYSKCLHHGIYAVKQLKTG